MDTNDQLALAKLLDKAITSDNASVKEMLQELLTVVALLEDTTKQGPLSTLLARTTCLEKEVVAIHRFLEEKELRHRGIWKSI